MDAARRRWPKGTWMKLKSPELLQAFMKQQAYSNARLARAAGCSRQFIWQLLKEERTTMTPHRAALIAEAMGCPVEVLFVARVASGSAHIGRPQAPPGGRAA